MVQGNRISTRGNPNRYPKGEPNGRGGQFAPKGTAGVVVSEHDNAYFAERTRERFRELTDECQKPADQGKEPTQKQRRFARYISQETGVPMPEEYTQSAYSKYIGENSEFNGEPSGFQPAKSIEEAEEYAKSLGVTPFYKKMDLEVANALNESLAYGFEHFPRIREKIQVVGDAQEINKEFKKRLTPSVELQYADKYPFITGKTKESYVKRTVSKAVGRVSANVMAFVRSGHTAEVYEVSGIYVNQKFGRNAERLKYTAQECEKLGWHPEGTASAKAVVDHEIGHFIDMAYGVSERGGFHLYRENAYKAREVLSEYAGANEKEYIAEGYSEWRNNPKPRRAATEVGRLMESLRDKMDKGRC